VTLRLEVLDRDGAVLRVRDIDPDVLRDDRARLRVEHAEIASGPFHHAVLRSGAKLRALYLSDAALPARAVATLGGPRGPGRWVSRRAAADEYGGGALFIGPDLFFRQVDLGGDDLWLIPRLVWLRTGLELARVPMDGATAWTWGDERGRWFYVRDGARWDLWGSAPTPDDVVRAGAVAAADVLDLLLELGAVRLSRREIRPAGPFTALE
jgi:hypothetical protein